MSDVFTIGLDFGTHQSKVCYEDASDPRNMVYTFLQFKPEKGKKSLFLPSVVQINKDKTLSYGFVNEKEALVIGQTHSFEEPTYEPPEPRTLRPLPPQRPEQIPVPFWKYVEQFSKTIVVGKGRKRKTQRILTIPRTVAEDRYSVYKSTLEHQNRVAYFTWKHDCEQIELANKKILDEYEADCRKAEKEFKKKHKYWEENVTDKKAIFRYFKIATFSKDYLWEESISPKVISTWYLTYVLFCIFEKLPDNSPVQMGIPESIGDVYSNIQKQNGEDVFYTAYLIYKHYSDKESFLKASYEELLSITDFSAHKSINKVDAEWSQILLLPEAFAGLLMAAKQGKIGIGMTLLADIGGGSTDISLFNVEKSKNSREGLIPNVSKIISLHKGLNYIYSLYKQKQYNKSFEQIRSLFAKSPELFQEEVEELRQEVIDIVNKEIYAPLYMAAMKRGFAKETVMSVLMDRPVVYSGGGGVYEVFHKRIHIFTEPLSLCQELLSVKNVTNKNVTDEELSILAVAYGLSIPRMKEPEMTPLEDLFNHMTIEEKQRQYTGYEHGISDVE